jgi:hypothetical protein
MHNSGFKKSRKQTNVIRGKRLQTFRVPHDADHRAMGMPDSLDNSIIGNCPGCKRRANLDGSEIMKAVHLDAPAIDRDALPSHNMAVDSLERGAKAVLNHLHPPADTQNWQAPLLGQIEKRGLGLVAVRSVAATGRQIVAPGKHYAADSLADRQRNVHVIRDWDRNQPAAEKKFYPDPIETIAARAVWWVHRDPLADGHECHAIT